MTRAFVDVHLHWQVRNSDLSKATEALRRLHRIGAQLLVFYIDDVDKSLEQLFASMLVQAPVDESRHYGLGTGSFENQWDSWSRIVAALGNPDWLAFFPQLLFPEQMTRRYIERWVSLGCAGIKLIEVRGEIDGAERFDAAALAAGQKEVFATCEALGLSLSLHADLRRNRPWIEGLLEEHPRLKLNLAHFGHSRTHAADLLRRWPDRLFSDMANLARHAEKSPDGYRRFMEEFPDQLILGSDGFLGDLSAVERHVALVEQLTSPETARRILVENPLRFLNRGGQPPA